MRLLAAALISAFLVRPAHAVKAQAPHDRDARRFVQNQLEKPLRIRASAARAAQVRAAIQGRHGTGWQAAFDRRTGKVASLSGGRSASRPGSAEDAAEAFLRASRDLLEIDPGSLTLIRRAESAGLTHLLYQQSYKGLPVEFARVKIHLDQDGSVVQLDSAFEPDPGLGVTPRLSAEAAFESVRADLGVAADPAPGTLVVFPDEETGRARLAWKFTVQHRWSLWRYYVDANDGRLLFRYDDLRHTNGTVRAYIYSPDPYTAAALSPIGHQHVAVLNGAALSVVDTDAAGAYTSPADGRIAASLEGPYVTVSNFGGPNAHYDNGNEAPSAHSTWTVTATPMESPHPYSNGANAVYFSSIPAPTGKTVVKTMPVFASFNVGGLTSGGGGEAVDITDDDEVQVLDATGTRVASYIGDLGAFNGASVFGHKLQLRLKTNSAGTNAGFSVAVSSFLSMDAGAAGMPSSDVLWVATYTARGMRSEINVFYHLNAMHDYFTGVSGFGSTPIHGPVNAMTLLRGLDNAFYNPENGNLFFGDVSAVTPSDALTDDATVPRHEYTHFVVDRIWPLQNFGQAGAVSEAVADYFSASSLGISAIGKYYNNTTTPPPAPGPLRELDCPGQVGCQTLDSSSWQGEIHADSLFLSQALWDVRKSKGQACADGLAFGALLFFPESFREYYSAMVRVDGAGSIAGCGGAGGAAAAIFAAFNTHGLLPASADAYEPNNGFQTAADVSTISAITASIYPGTDADFYSFGAGPGLIQAALSLPAAGSFYKAYALTLFDRQNNVVATAQPPYNGFNTSAGFCNVDDCTSTESKVTLTYNSESGQLYYLRVAGGVFAGNLISGSPSAVNSVSPYGLQLSFLPTAALSASIVSARYDQDAISFNVRVTTFVSNQDLRFAYARLRDQSLAALPSTLVTEATTYLLLSSSQNALGGISGQVRLVPGFANRFPAIGTVYLEVLAYHVSGSTISLGFSNPIHLTAQSSQLSAFNNLVNPRLGEKTTIKYSVTAPGRVTIKLYSLSGALVATLLDEEHPAGAGSIDWSGRNAGGNVVSSGIYLVHIRGPGLSQTKKIVVVK